LKILHVNNFFSQYGGAESSFRVISNVLERYGHELYYYATDKGPYFIPDYEYSCYFPKYQDKRNGLVQNIKNFFYNTEAKNNLENYLKEIKPDVVIIHNFLYHLTISVFDACNRLNIPVISYIQDPRLFCPGGMLAYSDKYCYEEPCIKGNPLPCIINRCKLSDPRASVIASLNFMFMRTQNLFNKCHSAVCLSEALKDLAVRSGAPAEKIHVINHFIDDEKLKTGPNYENAGYFLYIGRLDREKGVHYLLEAMKTVSPEIQLHIVGDGYEKENLARQKEELNLENVSFIGRLSGEELENEYKNCIATILPCNWFEAFGLTNIESFLYGKPVIASKIAAIPEIIEHGVNGLLVPPTDVKAIGAGIEKLHNNPELVKEMGKNGRNKVEEIYNSTFYYKKLEQVLNKIKNH